MKRRLYAVGLLAGAAIPCSASAATITVTTTGESTAGDGQCSLREAIGSVDDPATPSPDCTAPSFGSNTIVLPAGPPYTLSIKPLGADDNATGDLDIGELSGPLTIEGAGAGSSTIDATGLGDRIFDVAAGATVTIEGLTLTGGRAPSAPDDTTSDGADGLPGQNGGGIDNAGNLTASNVTLTKNDAGGGGKAGTEPSCTSTPGATGGPGGSGGGIYNTGTLKLTSVTLSSDHAGAGGTGGGNCGTHPGGTGGTGGHGGGLYNSGTAVVTEAAIMGNDAGAGGVGGVSVAEGTGGDGGAGGGIYTTGTGTLTVTDTTIAGDTAGTGGVGASGVFTSGGVGGCGGDGGGVANNGGGDTTITADTLVGDKAGTGGAGGPGMGLVGGGGVSDFIGGSGCEGGSGGGVSTVGAVGSSLTIADTTLTGDFAGAGGAGGQGGPADGSGAGGQGGDGGAGGSGGAVTVDSSTGATVLAVTAAGNGVGAPGAPGPGGTGTNGASTGTAGSTGLAGAGGGVYDEQLTCFKGFPCPGAAVRDTIVASDSGGNCAGNVFDGGHDLSFGDTSCPGANGDPALGSLEDNGGPTETLTLGPGSAAIDQVPATGAGCPPADQRGLPRPSGAACDIGAYELTPPAARTGAATAITLSSATITATAAANAGDATVHFEYGTSTAYGGQTAVQHVAGLSPQAVSADLGGLSAGTTYHFRVVAASQDGTTDGADATFTTAPGPGGGRAAPTLSHLALTPSVFAAASSGATIASRSRAGTKVAYVDSEAAMTTFVVSRAVEGARSGGRCVASSRKPRHRERRPACTRFRLEGSFTHVDRAGQNRFTFTGRLRRRRLVAGRYRLTATPRLDRLTGRAVTAAFRIVSDH